MYHGWNDQLVPPLSSVNYYNKIVTLMGGEERAATAVRLFMMPGMNHCRVGRVRTRSTRWMCWNDGSRKTRAQIGSPRRTARKARSIALARSVPFHKLRHIPAGAASTMRRTLSVGSRKGNGVPHAV